MLADSEVGARQAKAKSPVRAEAASGPTQRVGPAFRPRAGKVTHAEVPDSGTESSPAIDDTSDERVLRAEPLVTRSLALALSDESRWQSLASALSRAASRSVGEAGQVCEQVNAGEILSTGNAVVTLETLCKTLLVPGFTVPQAIKSLRLCVTHLVSGEATGMQALAKSDGAWNTRVAVVNIANASGADAAAIFWDERTSRLWLALFQAKTGTSAKFLDALLTTDPWRQYEPVADRACASHSSSSHCRNLRASHHAFLREAAAFGVLRVVLHGGGFAPELVQRVNAYNASHPDSPIILFALTNPDRYASLAVTMEALGVMADDHSSEDQWDLRRPATEEDDEAAARREGPSPSSSSSGRRRGKRAEGGGGRRRSRDATRAVTTRAERGRADGGVDEDDEGEE
jgi:hypothetical protein